MVASGEAEDEPQPSRRVQKEYPMQASRYGMDRPSAALTTSAPPLQKQELECEQAKRRCLRAAK
jgi:hypothetical protein